MTSRTPLFNAVAIVGVWSAVAVAFFFQENVKVAFSPIFHAVEYSYFAYFICFVGFLAMPEPSPFVVVISALVVFCPPREAWVQLISKFEDYQKIVVMLSSVFMLTYWINGLLMTAVEFLCSKWLDRYRIQKDVKVATKRPSNGKLIRNLIVNTCLVPLIALGIGLSITLQPSDSEIPGPFEMFCSTIAAVLLNEISFFYGHWLFHANKFLYGHVHKVHHEFKSPCALAAIYCHPVELVVSDFGPLAAGILLFNRNLYFAAVFTTFAVLGTQTHHCGFRWPWIPRHGNQPDFHDYHHERFTCNYGNVGFLDALHGTSAGSRRHPVNCEGAKAGKEAAKAA